MTTSTDNHRKCNTTYILLALKGNRTTHLIYYTSYSTVPVRVCTVYQLARFPYWETFGANVDPYSTQALYVLPNFYVDWLSILRALYEYCIENQLKLAINITTKSHDLEKTTARSHRTPAIQEAMWSTVNYSLSSKRQYCTVTYDYVNMYSML